jgi:DNA gyrase subunit A
MICVNANDTTRNVLVISENGYGKRTAVEDYRVTNRGGKGVKTINVTDKTGTLVGIMDVSDTEDLIVTCKSGITLRTSLAAIKESGRATQGVKIIRVDSKDSIAAISSIESDEEETVIDESLVITDGEALPIDAAEATSDEPTATDVDTTEANSESAEETPDN